MTHEEMKLIGLAWGLFCLCLWFLAARELWAQGRKARIMKIEITGYSFATDFDKYGGGSCTGYGNLKKPCTMYGYDFVYHAMNNLGEGFGSGFCDGEGGAFGHGVGRGDGIGDGDQYGGSSN